MEIRLVIFLAFASVTVVTNTLMIWFAYKAFANMTSKVTETVTEIERSAPARQWIESLQSAAQQAVSVTETTKRKMAEYEPVLGRAQEKYALALAEADSKLEEAAENISTGARKLRDVVAKPAFSVIAFSAGLNSVWNAMSADDDE